MKTCLNVSFSQMEALLNCGISVSNKSTKVWFFFFCFDNSAPAQYFSKYAEAS